MRKIGYLCAIISLLSLVACVNDKPTNNSNGSAISANSPESATRNSKLNDKNDVASSKPSRPTENIKVNKPQKGNVAEPVSMTIEEREALSKLSPAEQKRAMEQMNSKERTVASTPNAKPRPKPKLITDPNALPSACDLITAEQVSGILGIVETRDLYVKDGSGKNLAEATSRSCFFKWEYKGNPNAGVLVQVQKNPMPDEFPDWASYYVSSKRNQGDQMPDGSGSFRYKDFPAMGVAGAYNYELARYVWRNEKDFVFMIAFNLQSSEAEQLIWAEKMGKIVEKNFNSQKKN